MEPLTGQNSTFKNVPLYVSGPGAESAAGIIVLQVRYLISVVYAPDPDID